MPKLSVLVKCIYVFIYLLTTHFYRHLTPFSLVVSLHYSCAGFSRLQMQTCHLHAIRSNKRISATFWQTHIADCPGLGKTTLDGRKRDVGLKKKTIQHLAFHGTEPLLCHRGPWYFKSCCSGGGIVLCCVVPLPVCCQLAYRRNQQCHAVFTTAHSGQGCHSGHQCQVDNLHT